MAIDTQPQPITPDILRFLGVRPQDVWPGIIAAHIKGADLTRLNRCACCHGEDNEYGNEPNESYLRRGPKIIL